MILVTVARCLAVCVNVSVCVYVCMRLFRGAQVRRFNFFPAHVCAADMFSLQCSTAAAKTNTSLILNTRGINGGTDADSKIFHGHIYR